jgi:hypothetical protein
VQHGIHEIAGSVAGERASGAIGAVSAGSESHDQNAGQRIAESGNGLAPVFPVAIGTALLAGDLLAISDQTGAASAGDHVLVENGKPRHWAIRPYRLKRRRECGILASD